MCVIKASIYENLLTTFLDFKIVAWRFPSISATALVGLSKLALCHGLRHSAGGRQCQQQKLTTSFSDQSEQ
jgi:hypothetical protein